jgi:hypothetical protein
MPYIGPLPRQLTRLNFPALNKVDVLIACCPSEIKDIAHRVGVSSPAEMMLLSHAFPKLKSIAIDASKFCNPNGCFAVLDFSNMSALLKLDMVIKSHKADGTISFCPLFPDQLQSLTIKTFKKFKLTRKFIRSLPRNLLHFFAVGFGGTAGFQRFQRISIDDIYILDSLPSTICEMAIDSDKKLQDLSDVIPPNLHTFYSCKYRLSEEGYYMEDEVRFKIKVNAKSKFNFNNLDSYGGDVFKTYKMDSDSGVCNRTITILGAFGGSSLNEFGNQKEFKFDF